MRYLCLWKRDCKCQVCECRIMLADGNFYCKENCLCKDCPHRVQLEVDEKQNTIPQDDSIWYGDENPHVVEDFNSDDFCDHDDFMRRGQFERQRKKIKGG